MLKTIQIKNFALIESLEIEFDSGLNIITGETGAGKSIIVDALMLLLGERASTDFIRHGENKAIVEGIFELPENHSLFSRLEEEGLEANGREIIIHREIQSKGTSRCFLNDSPIQVGLLKKLGDLLVDFHGQHDHQLLLKSEAHISLLDATTGLNELKLKYLNSFNELMNTIEKYVKLRKREKNLREKEEFQRFELAEINKIAPQPNEETDLENELKIKENSELLFNATAEIYSNLYSDEEAIYQKINSVKKQLEQLVIIDGSFREYFEECNSAIISLEEIAKFVNDYNKRILFEPEQIEIIRERLNQLKGLRKKYGTFEAIFDKKRQLEEELALIENFDEETEKLLKEITERKSATGLLAAKISHKRIQAAKKFEVSIIEALKTMGISNAAFRVLINQEQISQTSEPNSSNPTVLIENKEYRAFPDGVDTVEFYISTNKGEAPMPLANVASGGEISRIMLAIKSLVAESDELPMLVFDEIDIGISGRIAQKVGITMKNLAERHQIIAITHLPQIAALGNQNIRVEKLESKGRTNIYAKALEGEEKLREIARLMSGEVLTEASLKSAKELVDIQYKNNLELL